MPLSTDFIAVRAKAIQQYEGARHLLNVTYPMVKDPKLLLGVINNINSSLEYSIEAILTYERQLRLVPVYHDDFQSKFNIFRYKSVRRNKIPSELVNLVIDIKEILALHKKSPMEFKRGNRFVICTKDYRLKTISLHDLKKYLEQNKEFLNLMGKITSRFE